MGEERLVLAPNRYSLDDRPPGNASSWMSHLVWSSFGEEASDVRTPADVHELALQHLTRAPDAVSAQIRPTFVAGRLRKMKRSVVGHDYL